MYNLYIIIIYTINCNDLFNDIAKFLYYCTVNVFVLLILGVSTMSYLPWRASLRPPVSVANIAVKDNVYRPKLELVSM